MSKKHLRSAVQNTAYHQLTTQINNTVFQEYGFRYLKGDEKAGQWRTQVPYFPELEEKLARQIQVYLNTIPNPADAKNPITLIGIIEDISYYLSSYTMKNPIHPNRYQASKALKQKLIAENAVLQGRLKTTPLERKQRKRIAAKDAIEKRHEIERLFREEQDFYRYHRGR